MSADQDLVDAQAAAASSGEAAQAARCRSRDALTRSAAAHRQAADVMAASGQPERADHHRRAAQIDELAGTTDDTPSDGTATRDDA